ncbi:hypothetical protein FEM48_Zijuj04G0182400 [Ziziphus jujuba var. spinosa]|uniref:Uncharacterized protein n=1 Tax=Ziziphus jujuba var. spinosa TaxID=714518 RepID=A0A978VLE9_ZIZJJ|nr:hypothetical protein FEM48_Zijuj04G0182400 [Ziziphus jujuba var. spinosa]
MAGALETLCGQAYGAGQYEKLGMYTYSAMISLLLSSKLQSFRFGILTTTSLHYFIPYGVGAIASTRVSNELVSNELEAGNSQAARIAGYTVVMLIAIEAVFMSIILLCCRSVVG